MAATIKQAVVDALDDLTGEDFLRFLHQLKDRREEPRVRRRAVDGKSAPEVADLMVSVFTERGAARVAVDTLRQMNRNDVAEELDSKIQTCVDKGDPTFRKTSTGELETEPSQEARARQLPLQAAQRRDHPVKKPEEVEAEAKARVRSEGGDPSIYRLVLSRYMIQFGQYKDQTFKWLLENDLGYVAYLLADEEKARDHTMLPSPLMANKKSLNLYAMAYPEVKNEVRFHRANKLGKERSLHSGQAGRALVGFGIYKSETLQDLYESEDPQKISYVNFLRKKEFMCDQGSKMADAIRYILKRDKAQAAAARRALTRGTTASRPTGRKLRNRWTIPQRRAPFR